VEQQKTGKKDGVMAPKNLREYRMGRKESQLRFWSRFGVTQSRGSRFEVGAKIPIPIAILLKLYFNGVITDGDLWRAKRKRSQVRTGLIADATGRTTQVARP